jgi:hypothetical protein
MERDAMLKGRALRAMQQVLANLAIAAGALAKANLAIAAGALAKANLPDLEAQAEGLLDEAEALYKRVDLPGSLEAIPCQK